MKQLIFALLFMAFFLGCHESNSVEPILDNSIQQNKFDNELDEGVPDLSSLIDGDTEQLEVACDYEFDPENGSGECCGGSLEYFKDPEPDNGYYNRHLFNAKVRIPSTMLINNLQHEICIEFLVNRMEKVTASDEIVEGSAWGTFKIFYRNSEVEIFKGKFTGEIQNEETIITMVGKGLIKNYKNRTFWAKEKQVCNSSDGVLKCWIAEIKGYVFPV
ncbi:MAG: hypothetical protein ABFS12_11190 [Bacteroidota bacterium]